MRKMSALLFIACLCFGLQPLKAQNKTNIPLPSPAQLEWQQKERIMFVHYSPAAWQGKEYDDWTTSLKQINPTKLNTDQWCEVAKSWGAKTIIFVAKHVGGFCWWQTVTTGYSIKNTPWKGGHGDVMKSLSASCKKFGLDLGVYVFPGDAHWGAKDGGVTEDPKMQKEYNGIYRQQLTELLSKYGKIKEVWFDGNCQIDVADILKKYAPDAVYFQGKSASLRWVGNEDGSAPDPNWYTLLKKDLATGVSTSQNSNVNGDAYAPVEVDVPLMQNGGHKWFWAPHTDSLLLNVHQLMDLYYKSVGHGAVLLLNSTPDTSGLIPASHFAVYKAFGNEIRRRFGTPLARTQGHARELKITLLKPTVINHTILREDLSKGQRVKAYRIEGSVDGKSWSTLYKGTSIGNKKIDKFENKSVRYVRVIIESDKDIPYISDFSIYHVTVKSAAK